MSLDVADILASRWLPAGALAVALYDHFITVDEEIRMVWRNRARGALDVGMKLTYFMSRYFSEGVMIYISYMMSGLAIGLNGHACHVFIWIFSIAGWLFTTVSQFVIILRLYSAWDKRRGVMIVLGIGCFLSITTAMVLVILSTVEVLPNTVFLPEPISACVFIHKPKALTAVLGALLFFDVCLFLIAIYHALTIPISVNDEYMKALVKDGAKLFLLLTVLRIVTVIANSVAGAGTNFGMLTIVWSINAIIASRLHLRIQNLSLWDNDRKDEPVAMQSLWFPFDPDSPYPSNRASV